MSITTEDTDNYNKITDTLGDGWKEVDMYEESKLDWVQVREGKISVINVYEYIQENNKYTGEDRVKIKEIDVCRELRHELEVKFYVRDYRLEVEYKKGRESSKKFESKMSKTTREILEEYGKNIEEYNGLFEGEFENVKMYIKRKEQKEEDKTKKIEDENKSIMQRVKEFWFGKK